MSRKLFFFIVILCSLLVFLVFMLYQHLRITDGGFTSSSEVKSTLPLIIQADVSLIAFWGLMLVFRIRELNSQRIEHMRNLWEIGFKRDELGVKIAEAKEDKEKKESLMKLYEGLGKDALVRKETIAIFYEWETSTALLGLLGVVFFVLSLSSGIYGISMTFHTELVDPFTYYTPIVCLFLGVLLTIFTILFSTYRIEESLEIR